MWLVLGVFLGTCIGLPLLAVAAARKEKRDEQKFMEQQNNAQGETKGIEPVPNLIKENKKIASKSVGVNPTSKKVQTNKR